MSDTEKEPTAMERLTFKIQTFGDDAPLEADEAAAFFGVAINSFDRMGIPVAELLPRTRRWRYGTLKEHLRKMESA